METGTLWADVHPCSVVNPTAIRDKDSRSFSNILMSGEAEIRAGVSSELRYCSSGVGVVALRTFRCFFRGSIKWTHHAFSSPFRRHYFPLLSRDLQAYIRVSVLRELAISPPRDREV